MKFKKSDSKQIKKRKGFLLVKAMFVIIILTVSFFSVLIFISNSHKTEKMISKRNMANLALVHGAMYIYASDEASSNNLQAFDKMTRQMFKGNDINTLEYSKVKTHDNIEEYILVINEAETILASNSILKK